MIDGAMDEEAMGDEAADEEFRMSMTAVEVQAPDLKFSCVLRTQHAKLIDGQLFIHLSKGSSVIQRLLSCRCEIRGREIYKIMPRTDIIEKLEEARNEKLKDIVVIGVDSHAKRFRWSSKMYADKVLSLPDIIDVDVPSLAGVDGLMMRMQAKRSTGRGSGIWVQMTSPNLAFLSKVVAAQYADGGIHNARKRKAIDCTIGDESVDNPGESASPQKAESGDSPESPESSTTPQKIAKTLSLLEMLRRKSKGE